MRWGRGAAAGLGVVLLVAGCSSEPPEPQSLWPEDLSAGLTPTGWLPWGGVGASGVVVDAAGVAWVDGPWQVARVDPSTGAATVWDAADDVAFASVDQVAPAAPTGVWLVAGDAARLFDGERFVAVLDLPPMPARPDADQPPSRDLLQVGDEVWVSGTAGVARWADGTWTPMAPDQLVEAGPLAVDSQGSVWAGGVLVADDGSRRNAAVRWDGTSWAVPAPGSQAPAGEIRDIAADPGGGVWVASAREGTDDHGVFRFDGATWTRVGPGGYAGNLSVTSDGAVWALASAGDGLHGSGSAPVVRLAEDGTWQQYRDEEGAPMGDELQWVGLTVAGDVVLVAHDGGLDRSQGDAGAERFVSLWSDPSAAIKVPPGPAPGSVLATGADEVFVVAQRRGQDANDPNPALLRRRDYEWVRLGPTLPGDSRTWPVLAGDGALWAVSVEGLMRITDRAEDERIVDESINPWDPPSLAAGPDGSVWLVDDGVVVRIDPDGTRTSIGRPRGVRPLWTASSLAASGEVVWVAGPNGPIHQWDGTWSTLPALGAGAGVTQMAGADDGSLWVLAGSEQEPDLGLARFADGQWVTAPADALGLAPAPDGTVCTFRRDQRDVACLDGTLAVARTYPVGVPVSALSVAPDGAVWVLGEQVARLSPTTPSPTAG